MKLMALRKTVFCNGEVYHVFNHSVFDIPIFKGKREKDLFLESAKYYLQTNPPVRFSKYREKRKEYKTNYNEKIVDVISFCLMPNHFHFLLKQNTENGIKKYVQKLSNSFAHYYALKHETRGHIFEGNFKAVHVRTNEQLIHVSRYIHLNPVTAYLTDKPEDYPHSSYLAYLTKKPFDFIDPSLVLGQFTSINKYKEFVMNQKDYQRDLAKIKHMALE